MTRRGQVFGAAAALMAAGVAVLVFRAGWRTPRAAILPADPAARAAYAAVPVADRVQLVPAWQALATPEGVTRHVRARDGNCPAGVGVPGAVILPCPFSQMRPERACWDFDLPCDLSSAEGVSFDFWCGDVTQFTGFSIYFKCGEGWRYTEFSPHREGQWHRVTIPKARVRSQEGAPGGWDEVSVVRLCGWRGGTNDTELALANWSRAAPAPDPTAAAYAEEARATAAWLAELPGRAGEWRGFWCHAYYGLPGKTWRETAQLLKANGFTAILPNLSWAGVAFYRSDVVPVARQVATRGDQLDACLAACRETGLACHVWKVCWNLGHHASAAVQKRLAGAGRIQVRYDGTARTGWMCPSHPDNLADEIRACVELAQRGVDGVHLDYIRYPDAAHCFCAGCRTRFAAISGLSLTNWPAQVREDAETKMRWREFRITNITALVRGVARHVRQAAPGVSVSAAVFQNPVTNPGAIGQDWVDWCRQGYLDFVCPMDYNYDSAVAFKGVVFAQQRALAGTRTALRPGIGLSCWKDDRRHDARRTAEEILAVRAAGLDGFSIFNLDARAVEVLPALRAGPLKEVSPSSSP